MQSTKSLGFGETKLKQLIKKKICTDATTKVVCKKFTSGLTCGWFGTTI